MLSAQTQRRSQALPAVRAKVAAHRTWLEQALAAIDDELDRRRRASPLWREREALRRRVPGIGPVVWRTVVAHRPERGPGAVTHLAPRVGLAPLTRARGAWRGSRAIWGGRQQVRAALSMAALAGVRRTPILHEFSERLRVRGTPKQVALVA
jgi:transposase